MTTSTRPFAVTGAALVAAGALFVATPTIDVNNDVSASGITSLTTSVRLVHIGRIGTTTTTITTLIPAPRSAASRTTAI